MHSLFIIDPLDSLNLATETSLLLIEELARRRHPSSVATVSDLSLSERGPMVRARRITVDLQARPFYELGPVGDGSFASFDLVLMRKDPPVDESYVFATHVLEHAAATVPVINNPVSLRLLNEKLLPLRFPEWTPPTLVSSNPEHLAAFAAEHGRIVLKPLSECSGRGIRIVDAADAPMAIQAALSERGSSEVSLKPSSPQCPRPLLAQRFLPGVVQGDKRIFVVDGVPIGAVNRIPRSAAHLANIHQGASVAATQITDRERRVMAVIQPLLHEHGLHLAGVDFIDGYLTEINVTSPSALRQINAVSGTHLEVTVVDFLERFTTSAKPRTWRAID